MAGGKAKKAVFFPGNGEKLTVSSTFSGDAGRIRPGRQMELLSGNTMLIVRVRFESFSRMSILLKDSIAKGDERDRYMRKRVRKFLSECCVDGESTECLRTVLHEAMREGGRKAGVALAVERVMREPEAGKDGEA